MVVQARSTPKKILDKFNLTIRKTDCQKKGGTSRVPAAILPKEKKKGKKSRGRKTLN